MAVGAMPTFVASNVSELATAGTDMTVPLPAEVLPGDLMIVFVKNNGSAVATPPNSPDGWTYLGSSATGNYYHVFWRIRVSGGDTEPTFVMPVSAKHQAHVLVYRNAGSISNFSAVSPANGTATYTHPTVSTTIDRSVVVFARDFTTTAATGSWTWSGATERTDNALTYASGLTNLFSTADVSVPSVGSAAGVQSVATGTVSNGTTRAVSFVINPVTSIPKMINRVESGGANVAGITQLVVDLPPLVAAGDLIVVGMSWSRSATTGATMTPPASPWVQLGVVAGTAAGAWIGYAIYDPSMGSQVTFTMSVSTQYGWQATAYAFRGADVSKMVATPAQASTAGSTTTALPALSGVLDESYILAIGTSFQTASTITSTFSSPLNRDMLANKQAGTSRFTYVSSASDVQIVSGTYAAKNIVWSTSSAVRLGVLLAIPPKPAPSARGSFFPFF